MSRLKKSRFIIVCGFLFLITSLFARTIFSQTPTIGSGDANGDGQVNAADIKIILSNWKLTVTSALDQYPDGTVNSLDIAAVIKRMTTPSATPQASPRTSPAPSSTTNQANYYVSPSGNDTNTGAQSSPWKTIQKAVNTTKTDSKTSALIHILPGTYREAILLDGISGTQTEPLTLLAENGPNTVFLNGSETSKDSRITWTKSTGGAQFPTNAQSHIYYADVSVWNGTPEIAVRNDSTITRLDKAHEPDWTVTTEWKYHENWWKADSGTVNTLTDGTNDTGYPQAAQNTGNLKTVNGISGSFLTGARVFLKDTNDGHDFYNALVTAHNGTTGTITLDQDLIYYSGENGMGPYTKYFIEGKSQLLDTEGEWFYDSATKRIYIWPPQDTSPASLNLEFAIRPTIFTVIRSSYVTLKDLTLQYANYTYGKSTGPDGAIRFQGFSNDINHHITFDRLHLRYNGIGIRLYQSNAASTSPGSINNITLKNSIVEHTDGFAMMVWHWPQTTTPFIHHLFIDNNEFGHMSFRGTGAGLFMQQPEKIVFTNNYLHHSGHNAIEIQQGKGSGNSLSLVKNNLSEKNCYNGIDCGAFKFATSQEGIGSNNVLVSHNIFRGTKGWTYAAEAQNKWGTATGKGYGGNGYYSDVFRSSTPDQGCAVTVFRNIIYDNTNSGVHLTRSRNQCVMNNVISQNTTGIAMNNYSPTTDGGFNNKVRGNILIYNDTSTDPNTQDSRGIVARLNKTDESKLEVNGNIYKMVGLNAYDMFKQDLVYANVGNWKTVSEIRSNTPWEDSGRDTTSGSFGVTTQTQYNIATIESSFGVSSVPVPSEVQTVINRLQTEFGITITNTSTVGRL